MSSYDQTHRFIHAAVALLEERFERGTPDISLIAGGEIEIDWDRVADRMHSSSELFRLRLAQSLMGEGLVDMARLDRLDEHNYAVFVRAMAASAPAGYPPIRDRPS